MKDRLPKHLILLGLLLTLQSVAYAVMPPYVYEEARNTSPIQAHVRIIKVDKPTKNKDCKTQAVVEKIFRNKDNDLKEKETITFNISCYRRRDENSIGVGGRLWQAYETLKNSSYLEVFLKPIHAKGPTHPNTKKEFYVPRDQVYIIPSSQVTPFCKKDQPGIYCY